VVVVVVMVMVVVMVVVMVMVLVMAVNMAVHHNRCNRFHKSNRDIHYPVHRHRTIRLPNIYTYYRI
jgi:hypothetical protein